MEQADLMAPLGPSEVQRHGEVLFFYNIAPWYPQYEIRISDRIPVHHHCSLERVCKGYNIT